jgi:DNA-binding NarL/FixJ family response regulator
MATGVFPLSRNSIASASKIRVLIIAEPSIFRIGLLSVLQKDPDIEVIGTADSPKSAIDAFYNIPAADVAIFDFLLAGSAGQELVHYLEREKNSNVIVMSHFQTSEDIHKTLMAGAKSFLMIDIQPEELLNAIRQVRGGKTYIPPEIASKLAERLSLDDLTLRERQIAELIATGHSNRKIADLLNVSEGTVKVHIRNIFSKLRVSNRSQAILEIFRQGIVRFQQKK